MGTCLAAALQGCIVFDPALYMRSQDPRIVLADQCNSPNIPEITAASGQYSVDTSGLTDDFAEFGSCTGDLAQTFTLPGRDGFFSVQMAMNQKFHFHVKVPSGTSGTQINPAVYVLSSCDSRSCQRLLSLDECGSGRDEHVTFIAPTAGRYLVGIDSRETGQGSPLTLIALSSTCGNIASTNNTLEHGETCDDGNTTPGDGCDDLCRKELNNLDNELEPNDDFSNANVLMLAGGTGMMGVNGALGGRCDFDMFVIKNVPANGSIRASLLDVNGNACPANVPAFRIVLYGADGLSKRGEATGSTGQCPQITQSDTFAQNLVGGVYYLRVVPAAESIPQTGYRLQVEVVQ